MTEETLEISARAGVGGFFALLERRRWLASGLLVAVAIGCFAATLIISGSELTPDSQDYAVCARQVARGQGYTTKILIGELVEDVTADGNLAGAWRNTLRPPFPVYAMALSFRLLGEGDRAVVYWSGAFYVATCWLILTAFDGLFGFQVAFLSGLVFAVSGCGIIYARSGLTESAAMFFLVLVFAILRQKPTFARGVLIGTIFAASSLNRPIAIAWAIGAAVLLIAQRGAAGRRLPTVAGMSVGMGLILLAAKFVLGWTGSRTNFAQNLAFGVGDPLDAFASPVYFILSHLALFARKVVWQIVRPLVYLFRFGEITIFSAIAPFGLLFCTNDRQRVARTLLLAMLASNTLFLSVLMSGDTFAGPLRYFDVFAPLALPWAVQLLLQFGKRVPPRMAPAFWCLVVVALAGSAAQTIRNPFPRVPDTERYSAIRAAVPENDVMAASTAAEPRSIAWYADRRVVDVEPGAFQDILRLRQKGLEILWFMTGQGERAPDGFQMVRTWPNGLTLWHMAVNR